MGFWPFGGRKRQRTIASDDHARESLLRRTPSDSMARQEKPQADAPTLDRKTSKSRMDDKSRRLSKQRSQGSKDMAYPPPPRSQTAPTGSVGASRRVSRSNAQYDEKDLYQQTPLSQSSLVPENFTVVHTPTLYAKRTENDHHLPRRKSSKRKAEDYAREREIRAMTSSPIPIPKRPATLYSSSPLQRDNRQIPGALNRRFERPTSEISLPLAGSLRDVDEISNQNSFKVGILAALSPRPTVRYDSNPRNTSAKQPSRPNMAIRQAIIEEDVSDKKRIDDLADDLDAGGLRELMERDRRRKERKREVEKMKLQRKLQRRADRQREEEARRARTEAFVQGAPGSPSRNPGRELPLSPTLTTAHKQATSFETQSENPFNDPDPVAASAQDAIRNPFDDEKDMDVMRDPHDFDEDDSEVPVPVRSPLRRVNPQDVRPGEKPSQSTLSSPISPARRNVDRSSLSQGSFLNQELAPDVPESASLERRTSDQNTQRLSSWTTFFKRGTRTKFTNTPQARKTPSEFSNTSRESFSRNKPPANAPRTFRRSDSATPQRTRSRFREDLPELPISPPDSRVQSPEANPIPSKAIQTHDSDPLAISSIVQTSGLPVAGGDDALPSGGSQNTDLPLTSARGMVLSKSLASVDSEASWLSGKPSKRQSGSHGAKPSQSSVSQQGPGVITQAAGDEDDLVDDDYYSRLSPASPERNPSAERRASSTVIDLQQEQKQTEVPDLPSSSKAVDEKWHQGVGRRPTLVQQAGRAKSNEGLLNEYTAVESDGPSSPEETEEQELDLESPSSEVRESTLMRAKSVDYKKGHARHVSAGSAKLLDIRRSSTHSDLSQPRNINPPTKKSDLALHMEKSDSDSAGS